MRKLSNLVIVFVLTVGLMGMVQTGWTAGAAARVFDSPPPNVRTNIYLPLVARDPVPPTPACSQLLLSPGFESDQAWRMAVSAYPAGYSARMAHSGLRSLRTGIDGTTDKTSYSAGYQDVAIPAGTADATLSFWWYPITAESPLTAAAAAEPLLEPAPELVQAVISGAAPEGTLAGDLQYAVLADQSGNVLQTMLWTRSNARTWQWASYPVSKSLIGRTVRVLFGVYNDGNGRSSVMYVDDVALTTCTPATPDADRHRHAFRDADANADAHHHDDAFIDCDRDIYVHRPRPPQRRKHRRARRHRRQRQPSRHLQRRPRR